MVRRPSPDDLYPYYHQRKYARIGGGAARGVLVKLVLGDLENLDDSIVSNIASFLPKEDFNKLCSMSKKVKDMCNHTRGQRKLDIVPTYDMSRIPDRIVRSLQHIEVHKRMAVGEITMNLRQGSYPYFNDPPDKTTIDLVQAAFNTGLNTTGSAFEEATKLTIDGNEEWTEQTLETHAPLRCIAQTTSLCCRSLTQFTLKGAGTGVTNDFIKLVVDNCPGLKKLEISKCGYATIEGSGNALQNGTNLKEVVLEDFLIDIPHPSFDMRLGNLEEDRFKENRLFPLLPTSVERLSLNGCGRWDSVEGGTYWRLMHRGMLMQFILLNPSLRWFRGNLNELETARFRHKYPKLNNPGSTELDLTPSNSIYPGE